ncbi:MAG TPA: aminopeptidase P family protein [Alphaproteobacteria bacterium]|nr:aminopeptidase P family protein [Alphaproteobacteria bacterium]
MSYKGDGHLEKLLSAAGETRGMDAIKKILSGINAAPDDLGEPTRWLKLFKTGGDAETAEQLAALKSALKTEEPDGGERLAALRAEMKKRGVDGFFIPRADEFQGEYVPARAERLAWITGFTGSAGYAVALNDKAAFFTDGRYTLQAQAQVDKKDFEICSLSENQRPFPTMTPVEWIEKNLPKGARFGIDPWVHTPNDVKKIRDAVERAGGILVLLDSNPLDAAWTAQPPAPLAPVVPHPLKYAGKASDVKRQKLSAALAADNADALAITLPEEICWLLNIRGGDVPCTPFALSYAIAHKDGSVDWFIDADKVTDDTRSWVGADVRFHPLADFAAHIETLAKAGKNIWIDPAAAPAKIDAVIKDAGAEPHTARSPLQLMKAKKNSVEIEGAINAHIRDGVAVVRFFAALSEQGAAAKHDELSATQLLQDIRAEGENFRGLSFDTISGAGGNGAIVHYRSSEETNQPLLSGPVYLVDSGAQYLDGTTDITRTIAVDTPSQEMKENFTRVLKGHIAVAMSVFPEGTTGDKLDVKARAALKEVGLDFAHGTGHGVGSYLSVHEGPCGISPRATTVPLEPGMIISNEPGYYKTGEYGIRIETLVTVIDTGNVDENGKKLLGFKTLTLAPVDRNLIEPALMSDDELKWLNDYHTHVAHTLLPLVEKVDAKAADFLKKSTAPIHKPATPSAKSAKINGFFL